MRIFGSDIPEDKRVLISLTYIFGIGLSRAKEICHNLNIDLSLRLKDLSDDIRAKIHHFIESKFSVGDELRKEKLSILKGLVAIKCRRGIRGVLKGLSLKGRTKANGKTSKRIHKIMKGAVKTVAKKDIKGGKK